MNARRVKYHVVESGEWVAIKGRQHRIACCDCGLVHNLFFRIRKGRLSFSAYRAERSTAAIRRTPHDYVRKSPKKSPLCYCRKYGPNAYQAPEK